MKVFFIHCILLFITATHCASVSDNNSWLLFKQVHRKNYISIEEESTRQTVWEANLAKIRKHNFEADLGIHSYYMGMNVFGDLTHEEFRQQFLSSIRVPEKTEITRETFISTTKIEDLSPSAVLNQIEVDFALPTELQFQGEIYRVRNLKQPGIAQKCTGNKLGLYVPYNAMKFFWSGFGVPDSDKVAAEIAQHVAAKEGKQGVTLEMLLEMPENSHIKPCKWTTPVTPECKQFWDDLSCEYATATRGEVRSIVGLNLNPNGAWLNVEKKQLEYNRSNGQDLWGFKEYDLQTIYCKDMATHNTQVPELKSQICT